MSGQFTNAISDKTYEFSNENRIVREKKDENPKMEKKQTNQRMLHFCYFFGLAATDYYLI